MFDEVTGEGICVIDLDTVMPGTVLYDFGDLVRTTISPTPEDEQELSKVCVRMPIFKALVQGYLGTTQSFLTDIEKDNLVLSCQLITLESAIRFLTDYLSGDPYFKIRHPGQNLHRCRAQLKLFKELHQKEELMRHVLQQIDEN